jgi:hypothetical protein
MRKGPPGPQANAPAFPLDAPIADRGPICARLHERPSEALSQGPPGGASVIAEPPSRPSGSESLGGIESPVSSELRTSARPIFFRLTIRNLSLGAI